jgi:branched-chain amino acid transport system substrate-binding protein
MQFLEAASKKAGSLESKKMADALRGLTIDSPFGMQGKITMREDQTIVDYAIGWGTSISQTPYVTNLEPADWSQIFELETEWKKSKNYI